MAQSILITEDDRVQREIIGDILSQSGYEVTASDSAEMTLDILKERGFELLLTDMRMPGLDGLELLRRAKRLRPELEVVVMTMVMIVMIVRRAGREKFQCRFW